MQELDVQQDQGTGTVQNKKLHQPHKAMILTKYYGMGCGEWDQQIEINATDHDLSCFKALEFKQKHGTNRSAIQANVYETRLNQSKQ